MAGAGFSPSPFFEKVKECETLPGDLAWLCAHWVMLAGWLCTPRALCQCHHRHPALLRAAPPADTSVGKGCLPGHCLDSHKPAWTSPRKPLFGALGTSPATIDLEKSISSKAFEAECKSKPLAGSDSRGDMFGMPYGLQLCRAMHSPSVPCTSCGTTAKIHWHGWARLEMAVSSSTAGQRTQLLHCSQQSIRSKAGEQRRNLSDF